jgi:hypothetical protein
MADEIDWSKTTFEGARRAQRREAAKLSFRERIILIEEMSELAKRLQSHQSTPKPPPSDPPPRRAH